MGSEYTVSDEIHITVSFVLTGKPFQYPCPSGGHAHEAAGGSEMVAYCLCGWAFVAPFEADRDNAADIAGTLARMQAGEHLAQEGVTE